MPSNMSALLHTASAAVTVLLYYFQLREILKSFPPVYELVVTVLMLIFGFLVIHECIFFLLRKILPKSNRILPRKSYFQHQDKLSSYKVEGLTDEEKNIQRKQEVHANLLDVCESLKQTLVSNSFTLKRPEAVIRDLTDSIKEYREGTLKIYFFGTQSTGKSSLVNSLLGSDISPVGPDKCTSCLVRIKSGKKKFRAFARYEDGKDIGVRPSEIDKKVRQWANIENRPQELIIEVKDYILGQPKLELIDSPGTGSAQNEVAKRNLEAEIVNEAIKSVAIAVIVYLPSGAQMQSHADLLNSFKKYNVSTVGVCNLDSNWASLFGRDKSEAERIIKEAERSIQEKTRAECFRITLAESTEEIGVKTIETARLAGADSISSLREYLISKLHDGEEYVARQILGKSKNIIKDSLSEIRLYIEENRGYIQKIQSQQENLLQKLGELKKLIRKNPDIDSTGTYAGGAIGLTAGVISFLTLPYSAPLMAIATAVGGPTLIGTGLGYAVDNIVKNRKRNKFNAQVNSAWSELRKMIESKGSVLKIDRKIYLETKDSDLISVLDSLAVAIRDCHGQDEKYNSYCKYQDAEKEFLRMQDAFTRF